MGEYPWLVPGTIAALWAGVAFGGRVATWLGVTRPVGVVMVAMFLIILAATLAPPGAHAPSSRSSPRARATCRDSASRRSARCSRRVT